MNERIRVIEQRVSSILAEIKHDPGLLSRLNPETNLLEEVGLDSLELTELVLRVEDELQMTLDYNGFALERLGSLRAFSTFLAG